MEYLVERALFSEYLSYFLHFTCLYILIYDFITPQAEKVPFLKMVNLSLPFGFVHMKIIELEFFQIDTVTFVEDALFEKLLLYILDINSVG